MLKNKNILVAGARGLLGSTLCEKLVKNRAIVIEGDINSTEKNKIARNKLDENNWIFLDLNITDVTSIQKALETISNKFGRLDGCVNLAYPRNKDWGTHFEELNYESLSQNISMQLGGTIIFAQQVLQYLAKQEQGGSFVNISSIQGLGAPKFHHYEGTSMTSPIEYTGVKAGIIAITKWLSKYYRGKNLRINCVSPGGILDNQAQEFQNRYKSDCMNKGLLDAEDVCGAILFLLSDHSRYVNGQNIVVDDGWSL